MKKIIVLAVSLVIAVCMPAMAGVTTIGKFYVEVPRDWRPHRDLEGFSLESPDRDCAVTVATLKSHDPDPEAFATYLSETFKGSKPQKVENSTLYGFTCEFLGQKMLYLSDMVDGMGLTIICTGNWPQYIKQIEGILATMGSNDPKYAKVFRRP